MKPSPIIFLDHDGVICLADQFGSRFKKQNRRVGETVSMRDLPVMERFDNFDRKAITVLNRILEETSAEIIVSSDWRKWASLSELGDYYEQQGIVKRPIGVTSFADELPDWEWSHLTHRASQLEEARCHEIQHWLQSNPHGNWVAVDDMFLGKTNMGGQAHWGLDHFVHTPRSREGIKQSGVADKIIAALVSEL